MELTFGFKIVTLRLSSLTSEKKEKEHLTQTLTLALILSFGHIPIDSPDPALPRFPESSEVYRVNLSAEIKAAKKLVVKSSVHVLYCVKKVTVEKRVGRKLKKFTRIVKSVCGHEQAIALVNVATGDKKVLPVGDMDRGEVKIVRGFSVWRVSKNGVNSEYQITDNPAWVVVALKTLLGNPRRNGRFTPAIYVPYSAGLNVPELREAGIRHLLLTIDRAYDLLDEHRVTSKMNKLLPMSSIIPKESLLVLDLIEHMDPDEYRLIGPEQMVAKVLTTIGANGSEAYRYAISKIVRQTRKGKIELPGARGLAQFIPSTYTEVLRFCPRARLIKDFAKGMTDHVNATMAQVCLANRDTLKLFLTDAYESEHYTSDEIFGEYIAAAYNGGPERAIRSCLSDPAIRWRDGSGLAHQTVIYVNEFRGVYKFLFPFGVPDASEFSLP